MDGYGPLVDEIREVVGRIALSYKDEPLAAWALPGTIGVETINGSVRFVSSSTPAGRLPSPDPDSEINHWTIDRGVLVNLVLRVASARARRWIVGEQRLLPVPDLWKDLLRESVGVRFNCELSIGPGWVDLLLAVDEWLIELGHSAVWGQIKEKLAGIRMYPNNSLGDLAVDIIDHAENAISKRICESCGAPGTMRDRDGWYYTSCDEHEKRARS